MTVTRVSFIAALIAAATLGWSAGRSIGKEDPKIEEYIRVEVRGVVMHGVVAIGGETTGTEITAKGTKLELDFHDDEEMLALAEKVSGKTAIVKGELEKKTSVERKTPRYIVRVKDFRAAD